MKKLLLFSSLILFASTVVILSCSKNITESTKDIGALNPTNIDLNAGNWRPVLLTGPTEFTVEAPIATGTPEYIARVNEIKTWQADITAEEKDLVKYWSAGAVLRWNEILRELVAKHNLPPYQNADGTYPFPNANNPLAYPQFPFSNPPFAARAYAYITAAQYDALVTTWYYKKLYKRAAPYNVDPAVQAYVAK